jgi:hypothetical protein
MFMVHCDQDRVSPYRQLTDVETALLHVGVCKDQFTVVRIIDPDPSGGTYGTNDHALALWPAPYPDTSGETCGQKAIEFFQEYLQ